MFAKLISTRLNEVNGWLDTASDNHHDAGTREWAINAASEEMAKVIDDLTVLKSATRLEVFDLVGMKVAEEYKKTRERLREFLGK
nr:MAG TPA: hypothetical protein [Caudoviricetes sp.]